MTTTPPSPQTTMTDRNGNGIAIGDRVRVVADGHVLTEDKIGYVRDITNAKARIDDGAPGDCTATWAAWCKSQDIELMESAEHVRAEQQSRISQKIPSPLPRDERAIDTFTIPPNLAKHSIVMVARGHEGIPVDARRLAKLINAQLDLLESLDREQNNGRRAAIWCFTEAAVIGKDMSLTFTGYARDWYHKMLNAAKAKAKEVKTPGEANGT